MKFYLTIQDKATSGKQGLGIKDKPKKVAGCYWSGKKTSLEVNEEESSVNEDESDKVFEESNVKPICRPNIKLKKLCKRLLLLVGEGDGEREKIDFFLLTFFIFIILGSIPLPEVQRINGAH